MKICNNVTNNNNPIMLYGISSLHDRILFKCYKKQIKFYLYLYNENNNNLLSPILGQYNIKPQDLIDLVTSKFNDPYDLSPFLIFNILIVYTKKRYEVVLRKFCEINMCNVFYQNRQYFKFFDILFFYKNGLLKVKKYFLDKSNLNYYNHFLFYFLVMCVVFWDQKINLHYPDLGEELLPGKTIDSEISIPMRGSKVGPYTFLGAFYSSLMFDFYMLHEKGRLAKKALEQGFSADYYDFLTSTRMYYTGQCAVNDFIKILEHEKYLPYPNPSRSRYLTFPYFSLSEDWIIIETLRVGGYVESIEGFDINQPLNTFRNVRSRYRSTNGWITAAQDGKFLVCVVQ